MADENGERVYEALAEITDPVDGPVATAKEITAEVDFSKRTVNNKLDVLVGEGRVGKKQVGARAVVYWIIEGED